MTEKKIINNSAQPTSNLDTRSAQTTSNNTFNGGNVGSSCQPTNSLSNPQNTAPQPAPQKK